MIQCHFEDKVDFAVKSMEEFDMMQKSVSNASIGRKKFEIKFESEFLTLVEHV